MAVAGERRSIKLLIMSNMYPSKEKSFAGIFVKNQYEKLSKIMVKDTVSIFYMERKFTSKRGSVLKYINSFFKFIPLLFKKFDIIHLHYFYPLIYLVYIYKLLHPKTKIVVTYHGSDITKKVNKKNKKRLNKLATIIDLNIPVGKALSKILKEKLNISANKILPVGVNDTVFYYEKVEKKYDFIYVGSLIHRKGVDLIINVAKKVDSSIKICLIGQGDYIDEVKNLSTTKENIDFFEGLIQPQIQKKLIQSKFLLLPTRNEGFPTSTVESMYCGVPVLVSDIPQTLEQVDEGKNGFIVPVDNEKALHQKMIELSKMNNDRYSEIVNTTLTYYKDISLTNVCNELYLAYNKLISEDA
tara:strand:- start:378 stop:1445 length:1068 start_codon:yes stop_codon:yes gene_type:complete